MEAEPARPIGDGGMTSRQHVPHAAAFVPDLQGADGDLSRGFSPFVEDVAGDHPGPFQSERQVFAGVPRSNRDTLVGGEVWELAGLHDVSAGRKPIKHKRPIVTRHGETACLGIDPDERDVCARQLLARIICG